MKNYNEAQTFEKLRKRVGKINPRAKNFKRKWFEVEKRILTITSRFTRKRRIEKKNWGGKNTFDEKIWRDGVE